MWIIHTGKKHELHKHGGGQGATDTNGQSQDSGGLRRGNLKGEVALCCDCSNISRAKANDLISCYVCTHAKRADDVCLGAFFKTKRVSPCPSINYVSADLEYVQYSFISTFGRCKGALTLFFSVVVPTRHRHPSPSPPLLHHRRHPPNTQHRLAR